MANYSKSTLCNPLYYVVPNRGEKLRLPPMIDGGKIEAICFKGNRLLKTTCRFLCTFEIGTTALRLTVVCWNRDENCRLGIGFSTTNLSVDESLYDALIENSKLPDYWESPYDEWSKSPVEIFSSQGSFFVSSLVGSSDGVNCLMEVVNGLNVSLKLRGCRSCKCSGMLAEVPPLGSVMFIATGKKDIEAAFAFEVEGTDLGLLVAIKVQGNENQFAAVFLNVADFMFDDALNELLDQTKWSLLLRQSFAYAKDGEQISLKFKFNSIPFDPISLPIGTSIRFCVNEAINTAAEVFTSLQWFPLLHEYNISWHNFVAA
ncbi:unnamed protein product [Allacma fusca]|uniref:Uncharacterized protein n=1 Tax=Allacma fusca TaxID=39272 RepID=A0A8J2PML1_9HEXA|nr:unnamed protein product [Allacma fusca]